MVQETDDFIIDEKNGELKLKRDLDREEKSRYEVSNWFTCRRKMYENCP